jgi:hypothetical protein
VSDTRASEARNWLAELELTGNRCVASPGEAAQTLANSPVSAADLPDNAAAAGLALGLRFNALALALVLLLAITGICTIAIGSGTNLLVVALRALAVLVSLQISYLIGSLIAAQLPSRVNLNV